MRKIVIIILVVLLFLGATGAVAYPQIRQSVFLPLVSSSGQGSSTGDLGAVPGTQTGLLDSVGLSDGGLLMLTLTNETNVIAYYYRADGSYSLYTAFELSGRPSRIDIRGCVWVVAESIESNFITVRRISLPAGLDCED